MPFDLKDDEKAPEGISLRTAVSKVFNTSITTNYPQSKIGIGKLMKIKSLSSKNQIIDIAGMHVSFNGDGIAEVDSAHRHAVEHFCNLKQGFFSIVEEEVKVPVTVLALQSVATVVDQINTMLSSFSMDEALQIISEVMDTQSTKEPAATAAVEVPVVAEEEDPKAEVPESIDINDPEAMLAALQDGTVEFDAEGNAVPKVKRSPGRPKRNK